MLGLRGVPEIPFSTHQDSGNGKECGVAEVWRGIEGSSWDSIGCMTQLGLRR